MGTTSIAVCPTEFGSKETVLQHLIISEEGISPLLRFVLFPSTGGFVSLRQIRFIRPSQTAEHSTSGGMSTCRRDAILWVCKVDIRGGQAILRRTEHTPPLPGLTSPVQGWSETTNRAKLFSSQGSWCFPTGLRTGTTAAEALSDFMHFPEKRISLKITSIILLLLLFLCMESREISKQDETSTSSPHGKAHPAAMFSLGQSSQKINHICRNMGRIREQTSHPV